jgi:hypothetical protein
LIGSRHKETWGAKYSNNKKIVAMTAALNALKGQIKLDHKLSAITNEGKRGNSTGKPKKIKKNTNYTFY